MSALRTLQPFTQHDCLESCGIERVMENTSLRASLRLMACSMLLQSCDACLGCTGSHSGVKMCRWTKSMLRGRGGCYKHSFYGIESHRCMETTPSLACANKCVFCWRHHTNPGQAACIADCIKCMLDCVECVWLLDVACWFGVVCSALCCLAQVCLRSHCC